MIDFIFNIIKKLTDIKDAKGTYGKNLFKTKTFWVNVLAIISLVVAKYLNVNISAEETGATMAVINLVLRLITSSPAGFIDVKK
jgi:hypothetical protein